MFFIIKNDSKKNICFFIRALTQKTQKTEYAHKPVRAEAASVKDHDGDRTRNLSVTNRMRYHCATWTFVSVLLNKNLFIKMKKTGPQLYSTNINVEQL